MGVWVSTLSVWTGIYLNGYVANLQVSGQVVSFLTRHLGYPIAPPALLEKIGTRFRDDVRRDAAARGVPVVRFKKGDRKIDVMRPLLAKAAATGRSQVVAVGVAQEFQRVFTGVQCEGDGDVPQFAFGKAERRTTCFYFYVGQASGCQGGHRVHRAVQRVRHL
jgi:hypothetical protein